MFILKMSLLKDIFKGVLIIILADLFLKFFPETNSPAKLSDLINKLTSFLEKNISFNISVFYLISISLLIIIVIIIRIKKSLNKLKILKAIYGNPPEKIDDVTNALQRNIVNNKLKMLVSNKMKGYHDDPDQGNEKTLTVEYSFKNKKHKKNYKEGKLFNLP